MIDPQNPPTPKQIAEMNRRLAEQFRRSSRAFDQPDADALALSVEANTKCGKCGGPVRAACDDSQDGDIAVCDLEVRTTIFCRRIGECDWHVVQWRPWRTSRPKEL